MGKINGVTFDSRKVEPGMAFVAIKGRTDDGHKHIDSAIKNGASQVFGEESISNPKYTQVADSKAKLGELASEYFDNPSQKLKVIGVTGTKGKTTTAHLIYHILANLGVKVGLISSNMAKIGDLEVDTGFHVTSPDVVSLNRFLKDMVQAGCEYAVVEVSSHGIDQGRIAGINFEVGVLTNIAPEHLDYHRTMKEYKKVKMSFVNSAKIRVIAPKDTNINILPGKYNNLNVEAALDTAEKLGFDKNTAAKTLSTFQLPQGRLEEISNDKGFRVVVDFAHTPDSLSAVLTYLKSETQGRLISVFGCAGERDTRKRFKMGQVSAKLADFTIMTAEDPRSENVADILSAMARGAKSAQGVENKNYIKIPDRSEAIAYALSIAKKGDVVGFFGKGHEKSMAYKGFEHPWSDTAVIRNFLSRDEKISAIILAAGKGTRMRSNLPKILHEICGKPMISYTLQNLRSAGVGEIVVVVSFRRNLVIPKIKGTAKFAIQKNPKGGTADAAKSGFSLVSDSAKIIVVINGDDSAFYQPATIKEIIKIHKDRERKLTFVSLIKENPTGLGRVIRGEDGLITKIVEEKDASETEKKVKEVNDGLYVFDRDWFTDNLVKIKKGPQGEYYLTDLIKLAIGQKDRMATYTLPNDDEWQGVNTPEQLAEAESKMIRILSKV